MTGTRLYRIDHGLTVRNNNFSDTDVRESLNCLINFSYFINIVNDNSCNVCISKHYIGNYV